MTRGYKPSLWVPKDQRPQVVYFAQNTETGHIKIGQTGLLKQRMHSLKFQVGPARFRVLATMPGTRETERDLHKRFADDALGHEWFRPSPALLALIESLPNATPTPEPAGRGGGR